MTVTLNPDEEDRRDAVAAIRTEALQARLPCPQA